MKKEEYLTEKRKRLRERIIILVLAVLIAALTYNIIQHSRFAQAAPFSTGLVYFVLFFALVYITVLLLILMLFLVLRNTVKLLFERKSKVLGSKLRTKLVVAFSVFSIIPTIILFYAASIFITKSIGSWFSLHIENSLKESMEVAQIYYQRSVDNAIYYAEQISKGIERKKLLGDKNLDELKKFINTKQVEYNLGLVEVFSSQHELLLATQNPDIPTGGASSPDSDFVRAGLEGEILSKIVEVEDGGDMIKGIVPVYSSWNHKDIVGVAIVNYYVPQSLVGKMKEISQTYHQYIQDMRLKLPVNKTSIILLSIIAMLIIFFATWLGFRLARGITEPIQELAEGTKKIAEGAFGYKIKMESGDEFGVLIDSFNKMTSDLQDGQEKVEKANLELRDSNIELDQRRRHMETVLKNIAAGVVAVDREGKITMVNDAMQKMFTIKPEKVLGKNHLNVLKGEHRDIVRGLIRDMSSLGRDFLERQVRISVGGRELTILVSLTVLRDESGVYLGMVMVVHNLTELIEGQRSAAWREVARRIAHEIKNPLTPIQLSAQRLRRRYLDKFSAPQDVFDECTKTIIDQVDDMKNLVNEFSSFARLPEIKPSPNDLNNIIAETISLYRSAHTNIEFLFEGDKNLPIFYLDKNQISRTIINLLDNAVSAIDGKGGEIRVRVAYNLQMQTARIEVSDTGKGVPERMKDRVFEPYFSLEERGEGLGLTIAKRIIEDHHGYIRVYDNKPTGTRFVIELPVEIKV